MQTVEKHELLHISDKQWAKRSRTTHSSQRLQADSEHMNGDCYDEAMKGYTLHDDGSVRSSWLTKVQWFSMMEDNTSYNELHMIEKDSSLSLAIKSQTLQLRQLKGRLWPAAQECSQLDSQDPYVHFEQARRACNPFEVLGEGQHGGLNRFFINRSAIKLANINAMLDSVLTRRHAGTDGAFTFVDLCGAPGGFSEYLMQPCRQASCRGYGMSLVGSNEQGRGTNWKIKNAYNYRICHGADGTGDIYNWSNVMALKNMIQSDHLDQNEDIELGKVHLVVADGGFDAQRDSEYQEELAQKICICQASAAITLLKTGGTFVMKMFGFQTTSIRTLMRNLMQAFEHIVVVKPISSRPASAERYVVFSWFKGTNVDFDGLRWRDRTFLGDTGREMYTEAELSRSRHLIQYLDEIDLDLITLNVKTCFAILSHLQSRIRSLQNGNQGYEWEIPRIDIESYRHTWHLS